MTINNIPAYAAKHAYIVARKVNGEYWFYGAYDTFNRAMEVAWEVDGIVFDN